MMEYVVMAILLASIVVAFFVAQHMDKIRTQAYLDKKVVILAYAKYSKLYHDFYFNKNRICCIEELNEAETELKNKAAWFNKKYRMYGYYIPPEILIFSEVE